MVPQEWIEHSASPLPRVRSTAGAMAAFPPSRLTYTTSRAKGKPDFICRKLPATTISTGATIPVICGTGHICASYIVWARMITVSAIT